MIRCLPQGICSWSYRLEGEGHFGEVILGAFRSSGELIVDGRRLEVCKEDFLMGLWAVRAADRVVARAQKPNPFTRRMEGEGPGGAFELTAESAFGRTMWLEMGGSSAVIVPDHPFTRRATIKGNVEDFTTTCFAFWLTAWLWRRRARNNS